MVLNTSREPWRGGEDRPPLLYSSREAMNEDFREEARPAGRYRARRFSWGYLDSCDPKSQDKCRNLGPG